MADPVQVQVTGGPVQKLDLVRQGVLLVLPDESGQSRVVQLDLRSGSRLGVGVGGKVNDLSFLPVVDPLKFLAAADGPVDGVGVDAVSLRLISL